MLKIHPWVEFETLTSQKKHLWAQKNSQGWSPPRPIFYGSQPHMLKIIPKFEPQNPIIRPFIMKNVSKVPFFQPKDKNDDFFDF